jgi:thiol-disulfide isomerase/thioredoxin
MKREQLETVVAVGILIAMLAAVICLCSYHHHAPAIVPPAVESQPVAPVHVAPSKDTTSHAPGIATSPVKPAPQAEIPAFPEPVKPMAAKAAKPYLAIVGAEWCGPCKRLDREVIPDLESADECELLFVDVDRDPEVAKLLMDPENHAIPQFVLFDRSDDSDDAVLKPLDWLIGYQSYERVKKFLTTPTPPADPIPNSAKSAAEPACVAPAPSGKHQACTPRLLQRLFGK